MSQYINLVKQGQEIILLFGREQKPIAKIIPIQKPTQKRKLGPLKKYGPPKFSKDFKFKSEEEFLNLKQ